MTKKIFAGCLLTAILLTFSLIMVSAAGLNFIEVTSDNPVNPGTQVPVTFRLHNEGVGYDISNIDLTFPDLFGVNSWTSVSTTGLTILDGGSSSILTTTLTIPNNQIVGTYSGFLGGTCRYSTSPQTNRDITPYSFSITVAPQYSLSISDTTISEADTQATITITNDGNAVISGITLDIEDIGGAILTYDPTSFTLNPGDSKDIEVTVETTSSLNIGPNIATITATYGATTAQGELIIERNFCKYGEQGTDLEITDVKIDNNDGDDEEWSPLDEVTIEVEVTNNGDEKLKDILVELGLFDSEGKNIVKDLDDLDDEEIDLGSIKSDDEDIAVFSFTIPADFESENYKLVIKAYSDDNDVGEDNLCVAQNSDFNEDYYQLINGEREEDEEKHVIFDNIRISPSIAQCGERVQLTGEVFNIGDEDYEDQVKVTLFNKELGLNLEQVVREDLDWGESEVIEFEFDIPTGIDERLYTLEFKTYYDYDEDDDTYDIESEDKFISTLRVEGNCAQEAKGAQITAELDSETPEAIAGKQVIINANLKNTGDAETTYTVSVSGYNSWSELVSLEPQIFSLAPRESKEVNIVLTLNSAIEGNKEFTIKASYGEQENKIPVILPVSSEVEPQLGPAVEHIRNNWFIYLIVVVNIILIIAIILVIRSMVAPRPM